LIFDNFSEKITLFQADVGNKIEVMASSPSFIKISNRARVRIMLVKKVVGVLVKNHSIRIIHPS
jgi:hypothetical protein